MLRYRFPDIEKASTTVRFLLEGLRRYAEFKPLLRVIRQYLTLSQGKTLKLDEVASLLVDHGQETTLEHRHRPV